MKTSDRINQITTRVKIAFSAADARAAIVKSTFAIPAAASTPGERIARAVAVDVANRTAPAAVAELKATLKQAVTKAIAEIDTIALEATAASLTAAYIRGTAPTIPVNLPEHLRSHAMALRGQPEGLIVARQLELASEAAHAECARLSKNWVMKTKSAIIAACANHTAAIYKAAEMPPAHIKMAERQQQRAETMVKAVRNKIMDRRIGA